MMSKTFVEDFLGMDVLEFTLPMGRVTAHGFMGTLAVPQKKAVNFLLPRQQEVEAKGAKLLCGCIRRFLAAADLDEPEGVQLYVVDGVDNLGLVEAGNTGLPFGATTMEMLQAQIAKDPNCLLVRVMQRFGMPIEKFVDADIGELHKFIRETDRKHPFRIYFLDQKGLMAKFLEPVNQRDAERLEGRIAKVNIEAFDAVEPLRMKDYILQKQELRLWWD